MTNMTQDALGSLLDVREDAALSKLKQDPKYLSVCREQKESQKIVEDLLGPLEQSARNTIRDHFEGEIYKTTFEIKAAYIQGLRDCYRLFGFLAGNDVRI